MASPSAESAHTEPQVVFRPGKKRKIYRQRVDDDEESAKPTIETSADPNTTDEARPSERPPTAAEEDGLSVAEIIRLRNARRSRLRGVEFRPEQGFRDGAEDENTEMSLVLKSDAADAHKSSDALVGGMTKRFAPQTGMVGELVNQHMEQFVESELARRYAAEKISQSSTPQEAARRTAATSHSGPPSSKNPLPDQPVMQGKLQEIDLGDEARMRNVAMTDRARRQLQGEDVVDNESSGRPKKVRLGKDGKPWRPRKRRGSDDVKRDQLVEEFLRENRLDVYDVPAQPSPSATPGMDEAADERIAEEFRREFMDAMSQRQQRKKPAQPARPGAKGKEEEVLKGPKLGGSRNSRAAMRDLLLKQEQQKKR